MPSRSLLLRVLLSLVLVVNGVGSAFASGSMAGDPEAPCHGAQMGDHASPGDVMPDESPMPDCCHSGLCSGVCAQLAQGPAPEGCTPLSTDRHPVNRLDLGFTALSLPPPVRPPIG